MGWFDLGLLSWIVRTLTLPRKRFKIHQPTERSFSDRPQQKTPSHFRTNSGYQVHIFIPNFHPIKVKVGTSQTPHYYNIFSQPDLGFPSREECCLFGFTKSELFVSSPTNTSLWCTEASSHLITWADDSSHFLNFPPEGRVAQARADQTQRRQETVSQGEKSSGQGCQTDRSVKGSKCRQSRKMSSSQSRVSHRSSSTLKSSSLPSVKLHYWQHAVGQGLKVPSPGIIGQTGSADTIARDSHSGQITDPHLTIEIFQGRSARSSSCHRVGQVRSARSSKCPQGWICLYRDPAQYITSADTGTTVHDLSDQCSRWSI